MSNYVVFHAHSDLGNGVMMDSATKYKKYIDLAIKNNMKAIALSEHGNVYNWIMKKIDCDNDKIKYIHGQEFYITTTLSEKVKESYHLGLYARNWEGVKELNKLSSIAFNKEDNHFYYRPRISLSEVINTSDNIIITTACLNSILWKRKDEDIIKEFLQWMSQHSDRCFLEIQYHNSNEQKEYNRLLYKWSKEYKINLIAGTDTHAATKDDLKLRNILQKSKQIELSKEDKFDLSFKTYNELVDMFKKQNALPESVYLEAIENTNKFANMVENFELDYSYKYPKISDNAEEELWDRIEKCINNKGIYNWNELKKEKYINRIKEEYEVFKQLKMCDYVLLVNNIIDYCKKNNISTAPRGSCNGSQTFWVLGITDIDSIKFDLPFFRFCNPERVSLGDVDIDMAGYKRSLVKDFLYEYPGINGSAIITYQTYALRGAIKGVGRGLNIPLDEVEIISKDIDEIEEEDEETHEIKKITTFHNKEKWEEKYPELLKWAYKCIGLIENTSVHACGFVATNRNIDEEIGTFKTDNCKWIISQNNMKCIDAINFVKMDFLVVDNVQIIEDVCKLAEVPLLNNDELDFEDINVWNEMLISGLGIFQFEKTGWRYLKQTLENFDKFKKQVKNITRLDIMTALNGIIRPVGNSIRNDFVNGNPYKSGMHEIDEFLGETLGYLIYQEQIMMWLYNFCSYTMGKSDIVRRGIAKKKGTEQLIPEIKECFINYCSSKFPNYSESHLKTVLDKFIQVIMDASDYGFSKNHSNPYSILGFKCAYLRHYYPLEFLTIQFNINQNNTEKTAKIYEFINQFTKIKVSPSKFRKSVSEYSCDKETNTIYKGIKSIKYMNDDVAYELYDLGKNQYNDFVDLLKDISEKTSVNKRQLEILIKINFFKEFGCNKYLLQICDEYIKTYHKKKLIDKTKHKRIKQLKENLSTIENEKLSIKEQLNFEKEILGYAQTTYDYPKEYIYILDLIIGDYSPKVEGYCLSNGKTASLKIKRKFYENKPFNIGDVIKVTCYKKKPKSIKTENGFKPLDGVFEWWIESHEITDII